MHHRAQKRLVNSSLEGSARRAFDFLEGDKVDESAFKALIRGAVALNTSQESAPLPDNDVERWKNSIPGDPGIDKASLTIFSTAHCHGSTHLSDVV